MHSTLITPVILCGGLGKRLSILAGGEIPKQFAIFGGMKRTLFQSALERTKRFSSDKIFVISNRKFEKLIKAQSRDLQLEIILEPEVKNTAISVILSALIVKNFSPNSVMLITPSDHFIEDMSSFEFSVKKAADISLNYKKIVTFGMKPESSYEDFYEVKRFVEKPDSKVAEELISDGNCFWNSGIFIAPPDVIINNAKTYSPEILFLAEKLAKDYLSRLPLNQEIFNQVPDMPFDKAVIEKSSDVIMLEAAFDWLDVGTPDRLAEFQKKLLAA